MVESLAKLQFLRSLNDPPVADASAQMSKSLEQDLNAFLESSGREFCDIVLRLGDVPVAAHKVIFVFYYFKISCQTHFYAPDGVFRVYCRFVKENKLMNAFIAIYLPSFGFRLFSRHDLPTSRPCSDLSCLKMTK